MLLHNYTFWVAIYLVLLIALTVWAFNSDLLRDNSEKLKAENKKRPFSWSRTQTYWWSLIIVSSFIVVGVHGIVSSTCINSADLQFFSDPNPDVNTAAFAFIAAVLGINIANNTIARSIEMSDKRKGNSDAAGNTNQDYESDGFFNDILSNSNGPSVQRLQAVLFNLVFGIHYFYSTLITGQLHTYDNPEYILLLMGISTSSYLFWKNKENEVLKVDKESKTQI